jgi:hypothetical protein
VSDQQEKALRFFSWWKVLGSLSGGEILCQGLEGRVWVLETAGYVRPFRQVACPRSSSCLPPSVATLPPPTR